LLIVVGTQFFGLGLLGEFLAHDSNRPTPDPSRFLRTSIGIGLQAPGGADDSASKSGHVSHPSIRPE
jgi:hypothetical protein